MSSTLTLITNWDTRGLELSSEQIADVEQDGFKDAFKMWQDGYVEGELHATVIVDDDEYGIQGYWGLG